MDKLKKKSYFTLFLPDTTANVEKKLVQKPPYQIYYIMTIPAYSKCYPKGQVLTLNALDTVIFTFIVFDDLTHFQKTCLINHGVLLLNNNLCKNEQMLPIG